MAFLATQGFHWEYWEGFSASEWHTWVTRRCRRHRTQKQSHRSIFTHIMSLGMLRNATYDMYDFYFTTLTITTNSNNCSTTSMKVSCRIFIFLNQCAELRTTSMCWTGRAYWSWKRNYCRATNLSEPIYVMKSIHTYHGAILNSGTISHAKVADVLLESSSLPWCYMYAHKIKYPCLVVV